MTATKDGKTLEPLHMCQYFGHVCSNGYEVKEGSVATLTRQEHQLTCPGQVQGVYPQGSLQILLNLETILRSHCP